MPFAYPAVGTSNAQAARRLIGYGLSYLLAVGSDCRRRMARDHLVRRLSNLASIVDADSADGLRQSLAKLGELDLRKGQ